MSESPGQPPDFSSFFGAFRNESERAAAVLGAAYVEAALERLFRSRLVAEAPNELFAARGPLGDFAGKIDLAYSLGWIPESLRNDLHIVHRIRNDFAHDPNHTLSFSDPSVRDRTNNLSVGAQFEALIAEATSHCTDPARADAMQKGMREGLLGTPRTRFELAIANAEVFVGNAIRDSQHTPVNPAKWTMFHFGTTEAPIGTRNLIPLTPPDPPSTGSEEDH